MAAINFMYPKLRVFWHETGHWIAHHFNAKYFEGWSVKHIALIKEVDNMGAVEYTGNTVLNVPENANIDEFILRHPAIVLGSLVYGCYSQSLYIGDSFKDCFRRDRDANGVIDFASFYNVTRKLGMTDEDIDHLDLVVAEQQAILKNDLALRYLYNVPVLDLLISDADTIEIVAEVMQDRFFKFHHLHEKYYQEFMERIIKIASSYV